MTLTLVSAEDGYVILESNDGDEFASTPLPVSVPLTMWDDVDLSSDWYAAVRRYQEANNMWWGSGMPDRQDFVAQLEREIADSDEVHVTWCDDCSDPVKADDANDISGGQVCNGCFENYASCSDCGKSVSTDNMYGTLHDEYVCEQCANRYYSWCDECDGYYHHNYSDEHEHNGGGCDCESPAQHFTMRNDGEPVLANDTRVTVALPSGVISDEGINQIRHLLRTVTYNIGYDTVEDRDERNKWFDFTYKIESLGSQWQTREGNYTKRLSKLAHKSGGLKITPEMLSKIGCIARDNSTAVDFQIEVTRDLNLPAEDFYHEDSCWWQSYYEGRCSLKSNGGIGMRTFDDRGRVQGRAWIMPIKVDDNGTLRATFDSLTPDAFMVFNGYGDLSGYAPARILSHMAGMTYRKISFYCDPMYVNGSSGYLVAPEALAVKYAEIGSVSLDEDTHSILYSREQLARELATV